MKAAVLYRLGEAPKFGDFPDPVPQGNDILVRVKAASLKNLDKGRASGRHYASYKQLPTVVGLDGVAVLGDGSRVFAPGLTGMMAEYALIDPLRYTPVPDGVDDATAAALPNAIMGAGLALQFRGKVRPGETVLVNGATGVTGSVAVQLARYYRAGRIIATGRNPQALERLRNLGADVVIGLGEDLEEQIRRIHALQPVDLVIDYLWGRPAEMILRALSGSGLHGKSAPVRFVTVGGMAGEDISLPSAILRSAPIELIGSGFGSVAEDVIDRLSSVVLPEMFVLAAEKRLLIETVTAPLSDVEDAWNRPVPGGKRLVLLTGQ